MSSCEITGFFCVARGNRLRVNKPIRGPSPTSASAGTWYALYDSTVSCMNDSFASAELRVYSPPSEAIHPDGSIVFVIGKAFIQTGQNRSLIDVSHMHVLPGDVTSPDYQDRAPGFRHSFVSAIGSVCGEHNVLDDRSRVFPVPCLNMFATRLSPFKSCVSSTPKSHVGTTRRFHLSDPSSSLVDCAHAFCHPASLLLILTPFYSVLGLILRPLSQCLLKHRPPQEAKVQRLPP
ncbi:hypothetical protein BJV77DRAFT_1130687 [Russula vinacea]|nr:hypothetical protein BJV77DRAFT_1130687 [Russula vinacea]